MSRGLRFPTENDMPEGMRKLLRDQGSRVVVGGDLAKECDTHATAVVTADQVEILSVREERKNKYGAVATYVNGIRFDSKKEARYYEQLLLRAKAGEVSYFLRQVPIHLPGGTKLVIDFLEFHSSGEIRYVDVKGRETAAFKIKRREVEAAYPIRIFLA